jgi:hypothetical protein
VAPRFGQLAQPPATPSRAAAPAPAVRLTDPREARADSARRRPWHEQPRFVMARSLLVPGWGQVHNRAWLKAGLVAGAEAWLASLVVADQRELDRLLVQIDDARAASDQARELELVNLYNARLDRRLGRQWLLGGVLAYALVDAYVDAHFRGFELEFKTDPALPAGRTPAPDGGGPPRPGVRLALRWDF